MSRTETTDLVAALRTMGLDDSDFTEPLYYFHDTAGTVHLPEDCPDMVGPSTWHNTDELIDLLRRPLCLTCAERTVWRETDMLRSGDTLVNLAREATRRGAPDPDFPVILIEEFNWATEAIALVEDVDCSSYRVELGSAIAITEARLIAHLDAVRNTLRSAYCRSRIIAAIEAQLEFRYPGHSPVTGTVLMVATDKRSALNWTEPPKMIVDALVIAFSTVQVAATQPRHVMALPADTAELLYQQPSSHYQWSVPVELHPGEDAQSLAEVIGNLWTPNTPGPLRFFDNALVAARQVLR